MQADPSRSGSALPGLPPHPDAGPFRLLDTIAETGHGILYRAERAHDFTQAVAVKLPRLQPSDGAVALQAATDRLRDEQRSLAPLQHPAIAALVDASFDARPLPWLAVEYIEGLPLDRYCALERLGLRQRLALVCAVLAALDHAHQHLVVHGDLNFSRILIDRDGLPHLVGFRPSRELLHSPGAEDLSFVSPESLAGQPLTTATDIYTAGLLLCLLLTGKHPFEQDRGDSRRWAHAILCLPPARPSSLCSGALGRSVRGDLDAILLRALAPLPAARYATAGAFAEDLQAFLHGLPVEARNGGPLYRLRRFAARNRLLSSAAALLLLVLLASAAVVARQGIQARRARIQAQARLHDMQRLTGSLLGQFSSDLDRLPGSAPVENLLLARAGQTMDQLARQAGNDAVLRQEIAREYLRLGQLLLREGDAAAAQAAARKGLDVLQPLPASRRAAAPVQGIAEQLVRLRDGR